MDLSNMSEYQKSLIETVRWKGNNSNTVPEWLSLWNDYMIKVDEILNKAGGYWEWIRTKDRKLRLEIRNELDTLLQTEFYRVQNSFETYRKSHPEEFKPRENE